MISKRVLISGAALLLFFVTAVSQGDVKHFSKDGLTFDYTNSWSITDESNSDAQQLTLNRADSDAQIRVFVHRGKVDTPEKLAKAKSAFIDPYVKSVNDTFVQMGGKPESKPSKTKIGEVDAEGVQLRASLGGEAGEADVYWLPLTNRVVVLTFFGPDAALKRAAPAWDMIRNTIKIEPPQPKASPSPKGKP
jgi:hypothetical protein